MKRITIVGMALAALLFSAGCSRIDDIEGRLDTLETRTDKIEETIAQLQAAVDGKYAVDNVESLSNGYRINFTNGKSIDILNGQDGANGKDGVDGQNGADGKDGKDGVDGQNGADGKDGKDGQDGAPGKDGQDGKDGEDGDTLFKSVTVTAEYVTIVLNDETETTFVLPVAVKIGIGNADAACIEFAGASTTVAISLPEIEFASVTATVIDGSVVTKTASSAWKAVFSADCSSVVVKLTNGVTNDSALLQIIATKKDGTTYTGSKALKYTGVSTVSYGGYNYRTVRMKDGNVWMAENLHYVPAGKEVTAVASSYAATTDACIWYPATFGISASNTAVVTPSDADSVVVAQGLLYNAKAALDTDVLPTTDFTNVADAKGICPDGWHIPTAQEWIDLVGACSATAHNNVAAPYYVQALSGASLEALNADGFNLLPYPYLNQGKTYLGTYLNKDNTRTYYGYCSMCYFQTSTGRSATQNYGAMITNNGTKSSVNVAYNTLTNGAYVRCVRND